MKKESIILERKTLKFILFLITILLFSCEEEFDYGKIQNAVKSLESSNVLQTTAVVSGTVVTNNGESLTARGICYNTIGNPTISDFKKLDTQTTLGSFTCTLTNLNPNTTYYARAYATNSNGTAYGNIITFKTQVATIPILDVTNAATAITQISSISGGFISHTGISFVTNRGVCFSRTNSTPTILDSKTSDGTGIGKFTSSLTNLVPNSLYYIRAYATNSAGTAYGDIKFFTTTAAAIPVITSTSPASFITHTTAISGGNVTSENGSIVTSRGVCWSNKSTNPTIQDFKTVDGSGLGTFISSLTNLTPGSTYYIRAYATNGVGTGYGPVISIRTLSISVPSGITTTSISSITQNSASSGGSIANDGGDLITSRGVCWSNTTSSPTIANSKTIDGVGAGSFTSSLTGLVANTTYYVRAYATNSAGTAYGNTTSFTTLSNTLAVGQTHQGGVIAYIFQSGDSGYIAGETHGLIAASSDQSTSATWGCSGTSISTSASIGTGQSNTTAIVNGCSTTNIAARICDNLTLGGYSDWYLPSYNELEKLYINRVAIGGFDSSSYWSSTQSSSTTSSGVYFSTGQYISASKSNFLNVRAIRKF